MKGFLFPDPPRDFPLRRAVRITLRALHVCTAGLCAGAFWFEAGTEAVRSWCALVAVTGAALLLTDVLSSFVVFLEVRGVVIAAKIIALLTALERPAAAPALLAGAMIVGVIGGHMPARFRHRLWLPLRGVRADERKG